MNEAKQKLIELQEILDHADIENQLPKGYVCKPLYGYIRNPANPSELLIDNKVALYISFIFYEYLRGTTMADITKRLNNIGATTPSRRKEQLGNLNPSAKAIDYWTRGNIRVLLFNPIYAGIYKYVRYKRSPLDKEFKKRNSGIYPEGKNLDINPVILNHHQGYITLERV